MRALITGGGGQLASDLAALLGDQARPYSHAELDIGDPSALDRAFEQTRPEIVFNCAAISVSTSPITSTYFSHMARLERSSLTCSAR